MINIGKLNNFEIITRNSTGYEVQDEDGSVIFWKTNVSEQSHSIGDQVSLFAYKDNKGEWCVTEQTPKAEVGQFGYLTVNDVNDFGAFMDWGISKDLFVPYSEQAFKMLVGRKYLIYVYEDKKSGRVAGTTRTNSFFSKDLTVSEGDKVDLLAYEFTDIGMNVVINNLHKGLVYSSETYKQIKPGDQLSGYVKQIREDGKIDISLQIQGYKNIEPSAQKVLQVLKDSNGFLHLNDKSDPLDISFALEMSKKTFKKAIGNLYKQRLIRIEEDGIHLSEE